MKIEIKLKSDHIFYLENKLEPITKVTASEISMLTKKQKNENSLLLDCFDKISAKAKTISRSPNIFDGKKKYKISLKYHEASILNTMCCRLKDIEEKASHYACLANSIYLNIDNKL